MKWGNVEMAKIKFEMDIEDAFIKYAESQNDFENGQCVVDVMHVDELILGAMLREYFQKGITIGIKKVRKQQILNVLNMKIYNSF